MKSKNKQNPSMLSEVSGVITWGAVNTNWIWTRQEYLGSGDVLFLELGAVYLDMNGLWKWEFTERYTYELCFSVRFTVYKNLKYWSSRLYTHTHTYAHKHRYAYISAKQTFFIRSKNWCLNKGWLPLPFITKFYLLNFMPNKRVNTWLIPCLFHVVAIRNNMLLSNTSFLCRVLFSFFIKVNSHETCPHTVHTHTGIKKYYTLLLKLSWEMEKRAKLQVT